MFEKFTSFAKFKILLSFVLVGVLVFFYQNTTPFKSTMQDQPQDLDFCNSHTIQSSESYTNPIIKVSGDPTVMKSGNKYYLYAPTILKKIITYKNGTKSTKEYGNYAVKVSDDLVNWSNPDGGTECTYLFRNPDISENYIQPFLGDSLWAPDVFEHVSNMNGAITKKYYLYYTRMRANGDEAGNDIGDKEIGVAVSDFPIGPFRRLWAGPKDPLILLKSSSYTTEPETGKQIPLQAYIDPNMFKDDDGKLYLVYKERLASGGGVKIFAQEMSSPRHFATVKSPAGGNIKKSPILLMSNRNDWLSSQRGADRSLIWEGGRSSVIEQPFLIKRNGKYFLLYSGNTGDSEKYGIGVVVSDSLTSPNFRKPVNNILSGVMQSNYKNQDGNLIYSMVNGSAVPKRIYPLDGFEVMTSTERASLSLSQSVIAPGAASIVTDDSGQDWIIYRQKKNYGVNWKRQTNINRIDFTDTTFEVTPSNGKPEVNPVINVK